MAGAADAELSKEAPDIAIRFGAAKDAAALAGIFAAAVHGIASRYYSPEQIAAWFPERPAADVF